MENIFSGENKMIDLSNWPHRWYGRWKEEVSTRAAASFPSIKDVIGCQWEDSELKKVVQYLESGVIAIASPGMAKSVLDDEKVIGTPSWKTDGVWLWPETLSYYVKFHKVCLPSAFIRHIQRNGYVIPPVDEEAMEQLDWPGSLPPE